MLFCLPKLPTRSRVKQCKQGKCRQVDFIAGYLKVRLNMPDLGIKIPMRVNSAFGGSGAAGCKQNGGGFIFLCCSRRKRLPPLLLEVFQGVASPEPAGADGNAGSDGSKTGRMQYPESVGFRNADKSLGLAVFQAGKHSLHSHARIYDNRNGAGFEQGKGQGKKIQAWRNHQNRAGSPGDADGVQAMGQTVGFHIQLPEC